MTRPRTLDLVCIGRAAVDLYGEQIGGRLEDMRSFAKYLGGSPANTAVGASRLGLRAAMLTRVGNEQMGRFVREQLAAEGVDVGHVRTDPERLTALVLLGIRDRDSFPLLFYRDRCADMAICADDIDEELVASATALLLSGTHFSQPGPRTANEHAIALARRHGTRVVLDIDYRPVLWGLTAPGLGEQRYVDSAAVSAQLQALVGHCDLIVGTEEEIHIAGGSTDTLAALRRLRQLTQAVLVCKRGPMGCVVFDAGIPERLEDGISGPGFPVEVFNVLGAGDAFMAGFLRGWLRGEPLADCCRYANGCGALVVSRHGCAPAMPSWPELQRFMRHGAATPRVREDAALEHLHRASTRTRRCDALAVLAFDHRVQLEALPGADAGRIARFKQLVAQAARQAQAVARAGGEAGLPTAGIIVDDRHGAALLPPMTGTGWWVARPVELPGSRPLAFESGSAQAMAAALRTWPTEHVAKCLVAWHPDDGAGLRAAQAATLQALQQACIETGREWLAEVIPPRELAMGPDTLPRALSQLYEAGLRPDWWKLVPPPDRAGWQALEQVVRLHDPWCRGVLLLGLEAAETQLAERFAVAAPHPLCKGFAVGRSIFSEAAAGWFEGTLDDAGVVASVSGRYLRLIELWCAARARPVEALEGVDP